MCHGALDENITQKRPYYYGRSLPGLLRERSSCPVRIKNFLLSTPSRPVQGLTPPSHRMGTRAIYWGGGGGREKRSGRETHLQLVPRSGMHGSIQPLLRIS
jgi:hypothetical protein